CMLRRRLQGHQRQDWRKRHISQVIKGIKERLDFGQAFFVFSGLSSAVGLVKTAVTVVTANL
ncbi:MAG: hypothetical protein VZQ79_10555, partial [Ruminococcus sp.]|nr:hypothetical protein [Ruminococcus sp.]